MLISSNLLFIKGIRDLYHPVCFSYKFIKLAQVDILRIILSSTDSECLTFFATIVMIDGISGSRLPTLASVRLDPFFSLAHLRGFFL